MAKVVLFGGWAGSYVCSFRVMLYEGNWMGYDQAGSRLGSGYPKWEYLGSDLDF